VEYDEIKDCGYEDWYEDGLCEVEKAGTGHVAVLVADVYWDRWRSFGRGYCARD